MHLEPLYLKSFLTNSRICLEFDGFFLIHTLMMQNKDYGGEPFVNGQAVPYDPKYHERRERNITPANKRNTIFCLPRNFGRSSNFERKRENMQSRDFQNRDMPPMHNQGLQSPPPQGNMPPPNMGGGMAPPSNFGGMPLHSQGGMPPNNYGGMPPRNQGGMPPNNFGGMPPKTTWVECCPKTTWVDRCQITWVRCHLRAIWEGCLTTIWVECHPQTWGLLRTWEVFQRIKDGPILRLKEMLGICQTVRSRITLLAGIRQLYWVKMLIRCRKLA
ncbi:hypothetical protein NL676_028544 [Syzygium grande]|nr:hypothetical protein NL676_028544 [Syzygium grande]